jgi:hypothetical protein
MQILRDGAAWQMIGWVDENPEWHLIEPAGFFDLFEEVGKEPCLPELGFGWGANLHRFLQWSQVKKMPFGLSDREEHIMAEAVIRDVKQETRALAAAGNERSAGKVATDDNRPVCTPIRKAILDLIPLERPNGTTGRRITESLRNEYPSISQSSLTSHHIPFLKTYYGVRTLDKLSGYYRVKLPERNVPDGSNDTI